MREGRNEGKMSNFVARMIHQDRRWISNNLEELRDQGANGGGGIRGMRESGTGKQTDRNRRDWIENERRTMADPRRTFEL